MTTLLTRDLSREVLIEGAPFKVVVSQTGVRITEKGRRKGLEVSWDRCKDPCCRFSCPLTRTLSGIPGGQLRQITLSVNDLQISCRTSYSPSVA
jgi:hypothetical protein